jgi:hypothetical protein
LNAKVNGKYKLSKIGDAISNSVAAYYDIGMQSKQKNVENQSLDFDIKIADSPLLITLIPDLKSLEPIAIAGRYNSINDSIVLKGTIPKVVYGTNTITNAVLNV